MDTNTIETIKRLIREYGIQKFNAAYFNDLEEAEEYERRASQAYDEISRMLEREE